MTDTAAKRRRALGFGLSLGVLLPEPDGTIDADDRAMLAGLYYAGASGPLPPEPTVPVIQSARAAIPAGQLVQVQSAVLAP
jgi:hypothetical protein